MSDYHRPQSDDMTSFDPTKEKVIDAQAGDENGNIYTIQKRVPLTQEELDQIKLEKARTEAAALESKLIDGTITEFELAKLNALYKIINK